MGSGQSRVEQHDAPAQESDNGMSRFEVKPSRQLVVRLEQQQRNQAPISAHQEQNSAPTEDQDGKNHDEQEQSNLVARRQEEFYARVARKEQVPVSKYFIH